MWFGYVDCKSNKHGPRARTHILTDKQYSLFPSLCIGVNHGTVLELFIVHDYEKPCTEKGRYVTCSGNDTKVATGSLVKIAKLV